MIYSKDDEIRMLKEQVEEVTRQRDEAVRLFWEERKLREEAEKNAAEVRLALTMKAWGR